MRAQRGFSALEVVLVIVIAGLVGGIGYYVYQTQKNNQANQAWNNATDIKQPLKKFTDPTQSYTFSYPGDWEVKTQPYREDWQGKVQLTSINIPGIKKGDDPITVSYDNTPSQANERVKYYESVAKEYPSDEVYKTLSINGYKTLHGHFEYDYTKEKPRKGYDYSTVGKITEDRYVMINHDLSSLSYIITSRRINYISNFDATDKQTELTAVVNSTKFLR